MGVVAGDAAAADGSEVGEVGWRGRSLEAVGWDGT